MKTVARYTTSVLLGVLVATACVSAQETPTPGFNNKIPESVLTPDTVETKLGTLEFFDGIPDETAAAALFANLDLNLVWKLIGKGSQYAFGYLDSNGDYLDGGKSYELRLPGDAPALKFMSVCVYDSQTRSMIQTSQPYPAKNNKRDKMITNDDGSLDVYFGPTAPAGKEANWIQTVPKKGWFCLLRLYSPTEPWFDKTWRPSEIELVG